MKEFLSNTYLQIVFRLIVGGVFIYSSIGKLFSPDEFAKIIHNYDILPLFLVNILAIVLPYLQFIAGVLLILGVYKKGNSAIFISLIFVFLIALIQAYARNLDINCGCFSLDTISSKSDILTRIFQDVLLLIPVLVILIFSERKQEIKQ
ncbi:MauE/DoxX family redox-associated membrane protein [Bacteroidota bacterium]